MVRCRNRVGTDHSHYRLCPNSRFDHNILYTHEQSASLPASLERERPMPIPFRGEQSRRAKLRPQRPEPWLYCATISIGGDTVAMQARQGTLPSCAWIEVHQGGLHVHITAVREPSESWLRRLCHDRCMFSAALPADALAAD